MNGVFELICIIALYLPVMLIIAALRAIQSDVNVIYSRTFSTPSEFHVLEALIRELDKKVNPHTFPEIKEAYEQGKKDAWMWTPTSESRPPIGKQVLTTTRSGEEVAAFLTRDENGGYLWNGNGTPYFFEYMVAWQKLPEPYKGEECNEGMES